MVTYEFDIKREILNDESVLFTPVVRAKRKKWLYEDSWERISCIYGVYTTMDLSWTPDLTEEQCREHIEGYKEVLRQKEAKKIKNTDYLLKEREEIEI